MGWKDLWDKWTADERTPDFPWQPLSDTEAIPGKFRVIFKHSTSCGISGMMLRRFQDTWPPDAADYRLVDVRNERELSGEVAQRYGCRHESPQVLIIRDGELVAHASHGDIGGLRPQDYLE